jgi:hypothetical protein
MSAMKFLRTQLFNEPHDISAIRLQCPALEDVSFKAFTLHGADNAPAQLDLYRNQRPEYNEKPVVVFVRNAAGDLELRP